MYEELNIVNTAKEKKSRVGIGSDNDKRYVRWTIMSEMDQVHEILHCRMVLRRSEAGEKSELHLNPYNAALVGH